MNNKEDIEKESIIKDYLELKKKYNNLSNQKNEFLKREKEFKNQIYSLKEQRNNLNTKCEELKIKQKTSMNNINKLRTERDNARLERNTARTERDNARLERNTARTENDELRRDNENIRFQRDWIKINSENNNYNKIWKSLLADNLHNEVTVLKDQIEDITSNNLNNINYDEMTLILPYKESSEKEREENLKIVLDYLSSIKIKNIIISEQDITKKTDHLEKEYSNKFNSFKIIFTKYYGKFNLSKAINDGIKQSKTPYILIHDADTLVPQEKYEKAMTLIPKYDIIFLSNRSRKNITDKQKFINNNYNFSKINADTIIGKNDDGGIRLCKKSSIEKIGLFNENFKGWGREDNEFMIRTNLYKLKVLRLPNIRYHLDHEKQKSNTSNSMELEKIYRLSKNNPNKLKQEINKKISNEKEIINTKQFTNITITNKNPEEITITNKNPNPNQTKISIIIPLYNGTKKRITRALNSIINQTIGFENLEVIIVDDHSDNKTTIKTIYEYVNKYPNIKGIILDHNSGYPGRPRNIGIKHSNSKYLMFIDHDDYYTKNACELLYKEITQNNAEIVSGNYTSLYKKNLKKTNWSYCIKKYKTQINSINEKPKLLTLPAQVWTKIYNKDFLTKNNIKFYDYLIEEDLPFHYETLFKTSNTIFINENIIFYDPVDENQKHTSISLSITKDYIINTINTYQQTYNYCNKHHPEYNYMPLSKVNSLLHNKLPLAQLNLEEFKEITNRCHYLIKSFKDSPKNNYPKSITKLLNYMAEKNYEKGYVEYKRLHYKTKNKTYAEVLWP